MIPSKKPTAKNDDGLVPKNSRDNRTSIELFSAAVYQWKEPLIQIAHALAS
jgi:hypothetical protein